jgi:hypothetical protein
VIHGHTRWALSFAHQLFAKLSAPFSAAPHVIGEIVLAYPPLARSLFDSLFVKRIAALITLSPNPFVSLHIESGRMQARVSLGKPRRFFWPAAAPLKFSVQVIREICLVCSAQRTVRPKILNERITVAVQCRPNSSEKPG